MCDQTHSFWDDFSHVMSGSRYLLPLAVDIYCHCPCLQLKFQGAWPATKIGSFLKYVFTFKIMISFKKTIVFGSPWSLETLDNLPDWSIDFSKWAKNTETVKFWVPTSKPDNLWFCLDNLNCPYFLSTKSFLDTLLKKKGCQALMWALNISQSDFSGHFLARISLILSRMDSYTHGIILVFKNCFTSVATCELGGSRYIYCHSG